VLSVAAGFDFFERSHALPYLQQSRLPQGADTFALRLLGNVDGVAVVMMMRFNASLIFMTW
jgi:hypothetical protein